MQDEEDNIQATLQSAFGEGVSEVLVVDGGSVDKTVSIAKANGAKVPLSAVPSSCSSLYEWSSLLSVLSCHPFSWLDVLLLPAGSSVRQQHGLLTVRRSSEPPEGVDRS